MTKGLHTADEQDKLDRELLYYTHKGDKVKVCQFLASGASVNAGFSSGSTPLCEAMSHAHPELVIALLEAGADISQAFAVNPSSKTKCNTTCDREVLLWSTSSMSISLARRGIGLTWG